MDGSRGQQYGKLKLHNPIILLRDEIGQNLVGVAVDAVHVSRLNVIFPYQPAETVETLPLPPAESVDAAGRVALAQQGVVIDDKVSGIS